MQRFRECCGGGRVEADVVAFPLNEEEGEAGDRDDLEVWRYSVELDVSTKLAAGKFRLVARDIDLRELSYSAALPLEVIGGDLKAATLVVRVIPIPAEPIFAGEPIPPHLQDWVDRWEAYWLAREAAAKD